MNIRLALALVGVAGLAGCGGTYDRPLQHPEHEDVGIWVSPQGCQSWYFNEGTNAFMSPRMTPEGKPVCNAPAVPPKAGS